MKSILVPTDFSPYTARAFSYAIQIAQKAQAPLTILHDYHVPIVNQQRPVDNIQALLAAIEPIASDQFIAKVQNTHTPEILETVEFEYLYTANLTVDTIIEMTEAEQYDLLVVGAKKQNALRKMFFSSSVEMMIDKVKNTAILAVPENANYHKIEQIAYSTRLQTPISILEQLKHLKDIFNSRLQFIHVIAEETRSYKKKRSDFIGRTNSVIGKSNFQLVEINHKDVEETLLKYLATKPIHLISFVERPQKALLDKLFINSIAKKMAAEAPVPVLVFRAWEDEV